MDINQVVDKLLADVERVGYSVVSVGGDKPSPPFAYSVGLEKTYKHPEIIITGLRAEIAYSLINDIASKIKEDSSVFKVGVSYEKIVKGLPVRFILASEENKIEYARMLGVCYEPESLENVQLLQMLWPDPDGFFPFESQFEERLRAAQPVLSSKKIN